MGRSGKLREAEEFIEFFIKQPNMQTYMALLSACRTHVDVDCAKRTAEKAFQLDINNPSIYVLLGNTFAMAGRMEDRDNIRNLMTKRGIQKVPGKTWGIIQGKEESFVANDQNHPEAPEIFQYSKELHYGIKKAGYKPNFNYVLLKDGKTKEEMMDHLCSHSERLFIAQALRKNKTGEPIIAQKNLRMCGDCHEATKFISLIKQLPIVIRDANRWHHFENGKCSCSDFF
uniref:DYW domain-containing protein n=1 Tax=Arcella intermedia TaxID=1963864 RepID=A0A6B2LGC4_9EUKA